MSIRNYKITIGLLLVTIVICLIEVSILRVEIDLLKERAFEIDGQCYPKLRGYDLS